MTCLAVLCSIWQSISTVPCKSFKRAVACCDEVDATGATGRQPKAGSGEELRGVTKGVMEIKMSNDEWRGKAGPYHDMHMSHLWMR